jgi:hypothetical protein
LQKEERISDEKWEKEKFREREAQMMQELQKLSRDMDVQLELARENMEKTTNARRAKNKVKRRKMMEIEQDIKSQKMLRMQQMFSKLDRQAQAIKHLKLNEREVRMHLKHKLT